MRTHSPRSNPHIIPRYQTTAHESITLAKKNPARLASGVKLGAAQGRKSCPSGGEGYSRSRLARSHNEANKHQQAMATHASNTDIIIIDPVMTGHPV